MEYQIIRSKDAYIPLKLFEAINRVLRQQINRSWRLCNETLRAALNNLTMSASASAYRTFVNTQIDIGEL
jgi:hypothetical protein